MISHVLAVGGEDRVAGDIGCDAERGMGGGASGRGRRAAAVR